MFLALGAASTAIDALKALTSSKSSSAQTTGVTQNSKSPFDFLSPTSSASASTNTGSGSGGAQISPETMSALLDAQSKSSSTSSTTASSSQSASDPLKDLFSQIDGNGDGKISKDEFESALGAGGTNLAQADDVFSKLDKDGDGSVSLDEMASALKGGKGHHHHQKAGGSGDSNSDPMMQALQGASSTSVTNSDGSTTTSLTYADGSKVTMTAPASGSTSSAATSSYNFIEQMIQREAKSISSSATPQFSVSA